MEQKNHATSWDKKSRNLLGQKEIKQPLGTKIHATSRDKKKVMQPLGTETKSHNLLGQKNHATSWAKKSRNLLGQKNHATSWYKKITQSLGHKINQPF